MNHVLVQAKYGWRKAMEDARRTEAEDGSGPDQNRSHDRHENNQHLHAEEMLSSTKMFSP